MDNNQQVKNQFNYGYLCFSMVFVFWLISIFEIFAKIYTGIKIPNVAIALFYKLINDFWTVLLINLLFLPLYLVLHYSKIKWKDTPVKILFTLIIIGQFALTKYHLTTLVNLGADFLGYSADDMYTTVTASETFSILYFVPFILFPLLYWGINKFISNKIIEKKLFAITGIATVVCLLIKFLIPEVSDTLYQNKLAYFTNDIIRFQNEKKQFNVADLKYKNEYPLLKPFSATPDVLAPFFEIKEEKPNIVMIIVEGLGDEFIGKNEYRGFTPFLDSLIPKSLYWENFVSNAGRTFGALPSILGSLPYGEKGFLEMKPLPAHSSLISILKSNGYNTTFYCGDESSFDHRINFLEDNNIDDVIDINKFGSSYKKTKANSEGFSWGYPDAEIFRKTLSEIETKKGPRLDVVMTLTNHEPFDFPEKPEYLKKVDNIINTNKTLALSKSEVETYKNIYASLLYTDHSIQKFMESYSKRPDYKNTIFVITGDHRLIPIDQKDKLCRFHVPLYIYSPMLKKAETFKSVSSHWDITPSLLSFLMNNYKMTKPEKTAWMSSGLDTVKRFRNIHTIPIMQNKGVINEFIYKDFLYSNGELFKINQNFETTKISDSDVLKTIEDSLQETKKLNAYLTQKNKIIPKSLLIYSKASYEFSKEELAFIKKETKGLNTDQIFFKARDLAFNSQRKEARVLCNYILNELPNYADVRTLKGRSLAWDKDYKNAEKELLEVTKRTPYYYDSYLALMDIYWWTNQDNKGIEIAKKALKNDVKNPELGIKLAKAYQRTKRLAMANKAIDSMLKKDPNNSEYIKIKKELKQ
ncbi:sulfatase [Flavobacterium sufflavum]|uniref:Sulfatase n=1 Tax=Flavobacterium sufflavum TaxID=1921138 RepID=A0A3S2U3S0_9FLAO|nr:LTA synthase family protein [Flavobacterium sufflavum]RVT77342.1 sulfatase [Flavobacterium sufflavum]